MLPSREVVAWLRAHSFLDVNVPVRIVLVSPVSSATSLAVVQRVVLDRELGVTPLMAACKCQCVDMVAALFEHGAVTHLVTANGDTALHFVWRAWLLPSAHTTATRTSLKVVAEVGMRAQSTLAILTALLAHGADPNAQVRATYDSLPLLYAVGRCVHRAIRAVQNAFGETALQMCGRFGLEECAKLLLAHDADAYAQDRHGKSAIAYANENDHVNLHRLLLNHDIIERTRARETERKDAETLLKRGRGVLSSTWSESRASPATRSRLSLTLLQAPRH